MLLNVPGTRWTPKFVAVCGPGKYLHWRTGCYWEGTLLCRTAALHNLPLTTNNPPFHLNCSSSGPDTPSN